MFGASAVTPATATLCVYLSPEVVMDGAAVSSGMGTCGLVGQIGVITGWFEPSEVAISHGATAISPSFIDWFGLGIVCFVLPAIICWFTGKIFRKIGWIKEGDLTL